MWRGLFITITVVTLYFAYSVAQGGGIAGFIAGVFVGAIITYLFMRFRTEAAANTNVNTQNVQVNLNQQRTKAPSSALDQESLAIINSLLDQKLLVMMENQERRKQLTEQFGLSRQALDSSTAYQLEDQE